MTASLKTNRKRDFQAFRLVVLVSVVLLGFFIRSQHIQSCDLAEHGIELPVMEHNGNCLSHSPQSHEEQEGENCCFDDDCHSSFIKLSSVPVTRHIDFQVESVHSGSPLVLTGYAFSLIKPPINLYS